MKAKAIIFLGLIALFCCQVQYDGLKARDYAKKHWNNPNHDCKSEETECTPFGYYGSEHCNYKDEGFLSKDDANFISQCILAGGYKTLRVLNSMNCVKWHCNTIDIIPRLANCLHMEHHWVRAVTDEPPKGLQIGDVLVYHKNYYSDWFSHACLVVEVTPEVKVACHSPEVYGMPYKDFKEYTKYEWLMKPLPVEE